MLALHIECLTHRYLLHRLNFLEGLLGFGLGQLGALEGRDKLGLSRLRVKLQSLVFLHESLELLLHLAHPCLLFLPLSELLGRFVFGLGQRLLQVRHFGRGPWHIHDYPIISQPHFLFYIDKVLLTFVLLELPLGKAKLFLGPLEVLLLCGDLHSQCGRVQQRSLHTHIDILILDSYRYYLILYSAFLCEHQTEHQGLLSMR